MIVKFKSSPQQKFTAEFEVKEYGKLLTLYETRLTFPFFLIDLVEVIYLFLFDTSVLPSFEVKLKSVSPFFYVDSDQLTINIEAT